MCVNRSTPFQLSLVSAGVTIGHPKLQRTMWKKGDSSIRGRASPRAPRSSIARLDLELGAHRLLIILKRCTVSVSLNQKLFGYKMPIVLRQNSIDNGRPTMMFSIVYAV